MSDLLDVGRVFVAQCVYRLYGDYGRFTKICASTPQCVMMKSEVTVERDSILYYTSISTSEIDITHHIVAIWRNEMESKYAAKETLNLHINIHIV